MSPENIHKLMGFYMEGLILGVILQYMVSASLSCFLYRVYSAKKHGKDTIRIYPPISHIHVPR